MKKLTYFILSILTFIPFHVYGVPASRRPISVIQPDGTVIEIVMHGDELYGYATDDHGNLMMQDEKGFYVPADDSRKHMNEQMRKKAAAQSRRILNNGDVPTTGTLRGLVILAEYSDLPFSTANDNAHFMRLMNEEGYSDGGATGSVRDYYMDQSYGQFTPEFDVVGPVRLPNAMAYYGADSNGIQDANAYRMIADACTLADTQFDVDFSKYDNNGDGYVDLVYVIYSGYAQSNGASSYTIWPHMWFLSKYGAAVTLDGVTVDRYACSAERIGTSGDIITGIGLICHEFSHTLGLPDVYDTGSTLKKIAMGDFDVMDSGCYNNLMRTPAGYSSFEKVSLGWLEPEELSGRIAGVTLPSLGTAPKAYSITSGTDPREMYLLETRSKSDKWDRYLPGEGLLAVYVDYDADIWDANKVNSDGNWRVHAVAASGDYSKTTDMEAVPFPGVMGVTIWGDRTAPPMRFKDGEPMGKPLTSICFDGQTATFDFGQNMESPVLGECSDYTETGFRAHWSEVPDALYYVVRLTAKSDGSSFVFEKVKRTYYTFTRLNPEETWMFCVKAVGEALESPYCEEGSICLADIQPGGVSGVSDDIVSGTVYTISGQPCGASVEGLPPGIYIRLYNGKSSKIIITNQ